MSGKDSITVTAGAFVIGYKYEIISAGNTSFTGIGSANNNVGTQFTATGAGTGTGTAGHVLNYTTTGNQNIVVFRNGVKQVEGSSDDYVASSGTSINFTYNLLSGDIIDVQIYELLTNSAYYLKTETYTQAQVNSQISTGVSSYLPLAGGTLTGDIAMGLHQIVFNNNSQAIQIKDAGGTASYVLYQDNADTLILGNGTTVEKIRLDTSGNEGAVVIDTNGNVGIGTLSPTPTASNYNSASLHISQVGSSSVGAQIRFSTGVTGHTASDGTFMSQWADSNFYITNQEANADIRFNAGGNSDMVVFDGQNGSVGINFSNPASTGARLAVMGDAGSNAIFVKGNAGSGTSWGMGINAGSTSADASFRVYDKDGSNSYLFVRGDGKVGIGTTSPDVKLHVEETTSNTGVGIKIESASWDSTLTLANGSHSWEILNDYSNSSSLAFYSSQGAAVKLIVTSDGNAHLSGQIDARIQLSSSGGANTVSDNTVYIRGNDDTAILNSAANGDIKLSENGTTRLFIKRTTGNVGIGTNNPGAKLHVSATSVPAANTTDTDELVRFTVDGNTHGRIDLHTTAKNSTRRSTVFRPSSGTAFGFGISAYNMGTLDLGRVDAGYTWNGTNGDGEYTGGITQQPRYTRKAHFGGQIIGNNTYYTIAENMNDTRFTIECFCGDASSRDYKKYAGYYTSTGYGVYGLNQLLHSNGSWNSGSFDMRVSAPNGNLSIDLRFSSYYSSSNIASWMCIYTAYV